MSSGLSGLSLASDSANATVRFRLSSSSTLVVADARRLPIVDVIVTSVFVVPPLVVISLPANRVLPLQPVVMLTRVSSAFANDNARSHNAFACSRVMKSASAAKRDFGCVSDMLLLPSGVHDIDVAKARRRTAVAHGIRLRRR